MKWNSIYFNPFGIHTKSAINNNYDCFQLRVFARKMESSQMIMAIESWLVFVIGLGIVLNLYKFFDHIQLPYICNESVFLLSCRIAATSLQLLYFREIALSVAHVLPQTYELLCLWRQLNCKEWTLLNIKYTECNFWTNNRCEFHNHNDWFGMIALHVHLQCTSHICDVPI